MRIGILGSGLIGGKLGALFARAGHRVVFAYARTPGKLARLARRAGAHAHAGTPAEAVRDADVVLIAVPWWRVHDVLKQAGDLSGKVLITCMLPMSAGDRGLVIGRTGSGAEALAHRARGAKVVSAFGTIPSEVLLAVYARRKRRPRPDLLYCSDDARAKRVAARLIRQLGFKPVDAGPLRMARYLEPFTLLIARLAYETGESPALAYRFERFVERS